MQKNLLEALAIDAETTSVIAVVGGGGKTSLIFRLMEEFVVGGKKVIVTTTTHMAYEPDRPFAEDGDTDKLRSGNFKPDLLYYLHVIEKNEEYYVFTSYIFRDIFFFNFNGG